MLPLIKRRLVPLGARPYRVLAGVGRGTRMSLDLGCQLQHYAGLYEREVYPVLRRFSRGIRTAIDVGAADGIYTLYFLRRTEALVYAFEPGEAQVAQLQANLMLNGRLAHDARLVLLREVLGESRGAHVGAEAPEWCATSSLDEHFPSLRTPCLIKIDVDGGEMDVLRGAEALSGLPNVRWIVETHSAELEANCMAFLRARGYEVSITPNAAWRRWLPEHRPLAQNRWLVAH